jgi:hypothetical protein
MDLMAELLHAFVCVLIVGGGVFVVACLIDDAGGV